VYHDGERDLLVPHVSNTLQCSGYLLLRASAFDSISSLQSCADLHPAIMPLLSIGVFLPYFLHLIYLGVLKVGRNTFPSGRLDELSMTFWDVAITGASVPILGPSAKTAPSRKAVLFKGRS